MVSQCPEEALYWTRLYPIKNLFFEDKHPNFTPIFMPIQHRLLIVQEERSYPGTVKLREGMLTALIEADLAAVV